MSDLLDVEPSAARLASLLPIAARADLAGRTPCDRYAVHDLLAHLAGLSIAFRASAEKDFGPSTDTDPNSGLPELQTGWPDQIERQLAAMVDPWRRPEAWEGMTRAGGADLPANIMGIVSLNEITVYGWDLACALGQTYDCDDATAQACLTFVEPSSQQGGGPFGPPRPVADDAPFFDRLLALTGRDPGWLKQNR